MREVWGNPVAWRETVTRAHGGLSRTILRSLPAARAIVGFLFLLGGFRLHPFPPLAAAVSAFFMASLVVLMTSTASLAGELRSRTLELLCSTRLSSGEILWGKLLSTGLLMLPAFATGVFMLFLGMALAAEGQNLSSVAQTYLLLRWVGLCLWMGAALLAVANVCHWIGLRARSASRVWLWTVAWAVVMAVGPPLFLAMFERVEAVQFLVGSVSPLISEQFWAWRSEAPIQLYCAVGGWSALRPSCSSTTCGSCPGARSGSRPPLRPDPGPRRAGQVALEG